MIVDTPALLAVLLGNPEQGAMLGARSLSSGRSMAMPHWIEACLVIENRNDVAVRAELETAVRRLGIGTGGRQPARLNVGDRFADGFAVVAGEPLLFKEQDFSQTDVQLVSY